MKLVIIGAVGYAKVVVDIAVHCGYKEIAFLDDNELIKNCMGYPVIGKVRVAEQYLDSDFFVAIGNPVKREKIQNMLIAKGLNFVTLIHPDAVIAEDVLIGIGTVVMAGVVINPGSKIGRGCIINTGSSVDHDSIVEDFVHIAVGSHLAGSVYVGTRTWIGAGAIVSNSLSICSDCMVGAGATVIKDICIAGTYVGIPAKKINDSYFGAE